MKASKNLPASVRQRLLNRAKSENRPFTELLQYYAMERFLYRLSRSAHADRFILKGALMLRVWRFPECRATMDIDLLGRTDNAMSSVAAQMRDVLATDVTHRVGLAIPSPLVKPDWWISHIRLTYSMSP